MKKFVSFFSILIVVFVSACANPSGPQIKPYPENEIIIKDNSPALTVITQFAQMAEQNKFTTAEEYAGALIAGGSFPFTCGTFAVEPGELRGFSGSITGFVSGSLFGPADGSIPFVGYVFRTESPAAAESLAYLLAGLADPGFGSETEIKICGCMVCIAMGPHSFT